MIQIDNESADLCTFGTPFETVAPLRSLLKKNAEWSWDATHDAVVAQLKAALCSAPVLALYSVREPVLLSVDASSTALGCVLLQAGRPVEFASLTLTDTQCRYAQIEKEMLAIVFGLERFHQYVFGRGDVTVESDHKPLEALFKKALDAVPARIQRMMLRVQGYNFEVVYKPGKYMHIADALSRAALPELMHDRVSTELEEQSCFLIQNVRFSSDRLREIKDATAGDEECRLLSSYISKGWPVNKCDVNPRVRQHWAHRDSLEYVDGVVFKDNLVYIPAELRRDMIQKVHDGHQGIERSKRRARDVMFWCGMSRDVERAVRACRVCAEHAARPPREPMIAHDVPALPWVKVGSDICEYGKKYYLILVDYFSNYIEVNTLGSITSRAVITAMKEQFARHGIPAELITDNGPAYSSKEFKLFSKDWGFVHTTSSPNYAQSNGLSERAVRTVKSIIKKSITSGSDFHLGLLNLRATPRDGIGSPSQLLMGRRLQTRLPVHAAKLQPDRDNSKDYTNIKRNREHSKMHYDAHARPLPELQPGDRVVVADGAGAARRAMRVTSRARQPRSYFLTDTTGKVYRRNRRHLIKVDEVEEQKRTVADECRTPSPSTSCEGKQTGEMKCATIVDDSDTQLSPVSYEEKQSDDTKCENVDVSMDASETSEETKNDSSSDDTEAEDEHAGVEGRDREHTPEGTFRRVLREAKRKARENIGAVYYKRKQLD